MNRQPAAPPESGDASVVDLNERNWLPRHHRGDATAFGELLRAYRALVMTLLYRYGVESAHRDDLFQEIFLKIHQAACRYRPSEPLRPWLVSIVLNTVRNHRRASGRRQHAMSEWQAESNPAERASATPAADEGPLAVAAGDGPHTPGPEVELEREATLGWLEQRIAELPEPQRDVLVLTTVKGLRMKEIAALLRMPENTVKTHLRRARLSLAERLAERDHPAATAGEPA